MLALGRDMTGVGPSPRPWRINPEWKSWEGGAPLKPPVLDANGEPVMACSEWMEIREPDLELIVRAVNAMGDG